MLGAILILMTLPFLDLGRLRGVQHRPLLRVVLVGLAGAFIILLVLGANHVENPFISLGQIVSIYYFVTYIFFIPIISLIENTLLDSYYINNSNPFLYDSDHNIKKIDVFKTYKYNIFNYVAKQTKILFFKFVIKILNILEIKWSNFKEIVFRLTFRITSLFNKF